MPDVALSASPSPLAALLSGGVADPTATTAPPSQGSDPFAALLASAAVLTKSDAPGGAKTADPLAALLASAVPVAIAPVAPTPIAVVAATPTLPVAAEALPVATDAAHSKSKTESKAEDDDADVDSDSKDDGGDPLADAIASGATAVLALAPAIVAPVQPQTPPPSPVQTRIAIDAPIAPRLPKVTPPAGLVPARQATSDTQVQMQAARAAATPTQINSEATHADAQTPQQQTQQQATDATPPTVELSPDTVRAVVAALKQGGANPATVAQSDPTGAPVAAEAPKSQLPLQQEAQQPKPAAALHVQREAGPVQPAPARRRSDEVAVPRRTGDTRKRVDAAPADVASTGLVQRGSETAQPTISRPVTDVQAKGDTIVEQTLTIARDGAWLDKLAHDIAGAGSGNDLHFKLEPQNLGALSVAIRQSDDGASIRLTADNQTTRDILVDAQPKLIAEARAQGLKVSDTQVNVRQDQSHSQNQGSSQDMHRWAQNQAGHNGSSQNGQNRQSSPGHQPFVSNLGRKAEADSESPDRDSDARYA